MKKNYTLGLFLILSGLFASAQPVLSSASFQDFSVSLYNVSNFEGVTAGGSGANQNWNYSALVTDETPGFYLKNVPVNSAPLHSAFPTANYCQKGSIVFEGVLYESFSFVKIMTTGFESLGSTTADQIEEQYTDTPYTPLSLNYGDSYVDTYQSISDDTPTSSTATYDAYGTLVTPFGTYTNVIRLKDVDSDSTSYSWLKTDPYTPVMFMSVSNSTGLVEDVEVYKNSPGLATTQPVTTAKMVLFPNPAVATLNLELPNGTRLDKITVTDLMGKTVIEQNQDLSAVNVGKLAAGTYLLRAYSGNEIFESKFSKE